MRSNLTPDEEKFCRLVVEYGCTTEAAEQAWRESKPGRDKLTQAYCRREAQRVLNRRGVAHKVKVLRARMSLIFEEAEEEMLLLGFDVEKARKALQFESYTTQAVWARDIRRRLEAEDGKVGTADAKMLDTAMRVTGDIGGAQLTIQLPSGDVEEIKDLDAEIAALRQEIVGEGEQLPSQVAEATKKGFPVA